MSKKVLGLFFVLLGLLVVLLRPSTGLADTEHWTRPASVSGFQGFSQFPSLAVDGSDNVYVMWSAVQGDTNSLLFFSRYDGHAWTRPVDVLFGGQRSVLAMDRFGDLNLLYLAGSKPTFATAYTDRAASFKGWTGTTPLKSDGSAGAIQMAIDDTGTIHALWTSAVPDCSTCANVVYQQSSDRGVTWSVPTPLSIQPADRRRVQLKIDQQGRLFAAWDGLGLKGKNQSVRYSYSTDRGRTWTPPQQFFGPKGAPTQSALGLAGTDQVLLLWQTLDHTDIYYQVSNDNGVTWGQPTTIPGFLAGRPSTGLDQYSMVTDSAGILHLAAVARGADPAVPSLYHLQWDGKGWSKPEIVYDGTDFPEYPTLALSDGNRLHLTWYTRGADSIEGPPDDSYQVWYSSLLTSAPAVPAPPTFTPAPAATITLEAQTPTPSPSRTPIPIPTLGSTSPESGINLNPFQQQLGVLAGAIPAILIIGIIVVLRLRPRRDY